MKVKIKSSSYDLKIVDELDKGETAGCIHHVDKVIELSVSASVPITDVLMHELVHGYFWECGLREKSNDEELVEWISHHIVEIFNTYSKIITSKAFDKMLQFKINQMKKKLEKD